MLVNDNSTKTVLSACPAVTHATTQTAIGSCAHVVTTRIENMCLENKLTLLSASGSSSMSCNGPQTTPVFGFESCKDDDVQFKFYTGLTFVQFMCLWDFLGPAVSKLTYWN